MTGRRAAPALSAWLAGVTRRAGVVILAALGLAAASLYFAIGHLGFDTDTANMLDPDVPFLEAFERFTRHFPQYDDTLIAVVEAPAPEIADAAAGRLARALQRQEQYFPLVYRPRGSEFLERHALLYLDRDQLTALADRLARAQPLLARLFDRPSLTGYFQLLREVVERGDGRTGEFTTLFETTATVLADETPDAVVSWQRLLRGEDAIAEEPARSLVVAVPRLDYNRVMAGRVPLRKMHEAIRDLSFEHPATRVRVTGKVALQQEELESALGGARRAGLAALVLVALVLYVAVRSWRLLAAALITLAAGMCLSAGVATLAVGHLNLISIAFAVLYVGLGINYAVHYLIRYREALTRGCSREQAVIDAGQRLGGALMLCTVTTAIGFLAFVPTDFAGVAELGLIAGLSMFVTLGVSYTLLPALLSRMPAPSAEGFRAALPLPSRWLDWPAQHGRAVRAVAAVIALAGLVLATQVRFDSDPLNLRDPESESVATAMDLLRDEDGMQRNLVALAGNREQVADLSRRLEALPTVRRTVALPDLVPSDQADKLQEIRDLEFLLGPGIVERPFALRADPDPAAVVAAADALQRSLGTGADEPAAERLAAALDEWLARVQSGPEADALLSSTQQRMLGTLPAALARLQTALQGAARFDEGDLPRSLRARYRSQDDTYLLQIFPAGDMSRPEAQRRFIESVRAVVPDVTGAPVLQVESGRAVVSAFRTALASAVAGIALVLLFLSRSVGATVRVLIPLLLGGVLTVAAMVLLGLPFNFANVIALPLLFGVGIDNGIHMISRQREVDDDIASALHSSTARAILFGALTTIVSFGNLALSPHLGTATMGIVLTLGMILILATTFLVLPALFRRGPEVSADSR